jgi:hypothetical protein
LCRPSTRRTSSKATQPPLEERGGEAHQQEEEDEKYADRGVGLDRAELLLAQRLSCSVETLAGEERFGFLPAMRREVSDAADVEVGGRGGAGGAGGGTRCPA